MGFTNLRLGVKSLEPLRLLHDSVINAKSCSCKVLDEPVSVCKQALEFRLGKPNRCETVDMAISSYICILEPDFEDKRQRD